MRSPSIRRGEFDHLAELYQGEPMYRRIAFIAQVKSPRPRRSTIAEQEGRTENPRWENISLRFLV